MMYTLNQIGTESQILQIYTLNWQPQDLYNIQISGESVCVMTVVMYGLKNYHFVCNIWQFHDMVYRRPENYWSGTQC